MTNALPSNCDVVVVGGGLAGLTCARRLAARGADVHVLEASDDVGGRVRTDEVGGFLIDRGFQVLLPAYPALRSEVDVAELDLQPFRREARIWAGDRFVDLADPFAHPLSALRSLPHIPGGVAGARAVLRMRAAALRGPVNELVGVDHEQPLDAWLDAIEAPAQLVTQLIRPFATGFSLDESLQSSDVAFRFVFGMFARGGAAVPARGMNELPRLLAAPIGDRIHLGVRVRAVDASSVTLEGGNTITARHVVVAASPPVAHDLLGSRMGPVEMAAANTIYFDAPESPVGKASLVLDGSGTGPVNHLAVMSDVAPRYAPAGRSLIAAAVLDKHARGIDDAALVAAARRQLATWWGPQVDDWNVVSVHHERWALPLQRPPALTQQQWPVQLDDTLWVCGDHRDTASINGAMVTGQRVGDAISSQLAAAAA